MNLQSPLALPSFTISGEPKPCPQIAQIKLVIKQAGVQEAGKEMGGGILKSLGKVQLN